MSKIRALIGFLTPNEIKDEAKNSGQVFLSRFNYLLESFSVGILNSVNSEGWNGVKGDSGVNEGASRKILKGFWASEAFKRFFLKSSKKTILFWLQSNYNN